LKYKLDRNQSKKLVKLTGFTPRVSQLGYKKRITLKIHKGGNKYLRRAVILAYQNIYEKGNIKTQLKRLC